MKEYIEVRNNAESLIFNTEKTLKDIGDKISNEEKSKLEAELEKIVTHVVPLKESDKVFDMIADPECGTIKIVVDCENV